MQYICWQWGRLPCGFLRRLDLDHYLRQVFSTRSPGRIVLFAKEEEEGFGQLPNEIGKPGKLQESAVMKRVNENKKDNSEKRCQLRVEKAAPL